MDYCNQLLRDTQKYSFNATLYDPLLDGAKQIYTVEEAVEATMDGSNNSISITYK